MLCIVSGVVNITFFLQHRKLWSLFCEVHIGILKPFSHNFLTWLSILFWLPKILHTKNTLGISTLKGGGVGPPGECDLWIARQCSKQSSAHWSGRKLGGGVSWWGLRVWEMMYRFLGRLEDPHSLQEISLCWFHDVIFTHFDGNQNGRKDVFPYQNGRKHTRRSSSIKGRPPKT